MYDLCVIGAGCIGSAAAKHASHWGKVCLVGPSEPEDRYSTDKRDIFGAHYDEGRITRSSDKDFIWSTLARESIARYRNLEQSTAIQFYDEVGYIICGPRDEDFLNNNKRYAAEYGIKAKNLSNNDLKKYFPYLNFSAKDEAIYEVANSGYISPRRMIEAQINSAKLRGCQVIHQIAQKIERCVKKNKKLMCITTENGEQIFSDKVLIATGAFTSFRELLPDGLQVDVNLCPITVARIEISKDDFIKIRNMPSISYVGHGASDWVSEFKRGPNDTISFYMLPPVKYPDGKYYIKLGHYWEDHPLLMHTADEVKAWFCGGGDKKIIQDTVSLIKDIVKGITVVSYKYDCCIIVKTPTRRPYIDMIHSQLAVALGGNGAAAKSGDEIGRIAASMIMKNIWDSVLPRDDFRVKFKKHESKV